MNKNNLEKNCPIRLFRQCIAVENKHTVIHLYPADSQKNDGVTIHRANY